MGVQLRLLLLHGMHHLQLVLVLVLLYASSWRACCSPSIIFCAASWSGHLTMLLSTSSRVKLAMSTLLPTSITSLTYAKICEAIQRRQQSNIIVSRERADVCKSRL